MEVHLADASTRLNRVVDAYVLGQLPVSRYASCLKGFKPISTRARSQQELAETLRKLVRCGKLRRPSAFDQNRQPTRKLWDSEGSPATSEAPRAAKFLTL